MSATQVKKPRPRCVADVRRKPISGVPMELVKTGPAAEGRSLPLLVEPREGDIDLVEWAAHNAAHVEELLLAHGAVLFRGFGVETAEMFEGFARVFCRDLYNENGEHPRESVSGHVYTPVFYPPDKQLLWHNENSFNHRWPLKIWFGCLTPPAEGGETPVADSREVYRRVPAAIRERFAGRKVMYVRNYGDGLGLHWRTVFRTDDPREIEEHCRLNRMTCEWKSGGRLRTRSVRPAVAAHPRTGEYVWFNQAQHWHTSCLDPAVRESLRELFSEEDMPRQCYYGDGSVIEDEVMDAVCDVYRELEVAAPWCRGDVMMVDNMLAAHGRNPFAGERKLLVAMGEMQTED
jgi:alpha-ketoglutarate-dependent taurine dioxygenase